MTASMDAMEEEQKGHVLEEFKDLQEVKSLIASLENTYNDQVAREASCERFTCNVFTPMTHYLFINIQNFLILIYWHYILTVWLS